MESGVQIFVLTLIIIGNFWYINKSLEKIIDELQKLRRGDKK